MQPVSYTHLDVYKRQLFEHMLSGMQAQEAPQIGRVETDFYRNSVRMGKECEKDGGYWEDVYKRQPNGVID